MKRVIFTGFFGMTSKHSHIYINMWESLGYKIDYEPYKISDVLLGGNRFEKIRNNFKPKHKHYDMMYCISGGCLHAHNLISAKNNFTIDKIIFDSGPYLFSTKHIEHYINNTYSYKLPLSNIMDTIYKIRKVDHVQYNKEYYNTLLKKDIPKLIITSKKDKIIVRQFIESLILNDNNIKYCEFENGKHANIYNYNKTEYIDAIKNFIK